jgi:prepilin signal peptidase PulO-like enzyme (type II secretory pathway)
MLVYRINIGENLFGRSYCDFTKKPLKVIDLIPIFSYILFKGKCRDCKKKIPLLYPLIELLLGIVSVLVFYKISSIVNIQADNLIQIIGYWLFIFSFCFTFVFFAYYDLLYWEVDFKSVIIALIFFGLVNIVNIFLPLPFIGDSLDNLSGGIFLSGLIFIIFKLSKGGGMGEGDIYLFALSGLLLGFLGGLIALVITSLSGSLVGIIIALSKKKHIKGMKIQLAPYIAFGTILVLFLKDFLIGWILKI